MVNYEELIKRLSRSAEPFGLLTMQATSTTARLRKEFNARLRALYAAEHGFFGTTANGLTENQLASVRVNGKKVTLDNDGWIQKFGMTLMIR